MLIRLGLVSAVILGISFGGQTKAAEACKELKTIETKIQNLENLRVELSQKVRSSLSLPAKMISRALLSGKTELEKSISETDSHYVYDLGPEIYSVSPSWISSAYISEKYFGMAKSTENLCELREIEKVFVAPNLQGIQKFYSARSNTTVNSFEKVRLNYKMVVAHIDSLISYSRAIYANQGSKQQMCLKAKMTSSLSLEKSITDQPEIFNLRKSGSLTSIDQLSKNLSALCENLKQDTLCDNEEGGIPFVTLCGKQDNFAQTIRVDLSR